MSNCVSHSHEISRRGALKAATAIAVSSLANIFTVENAHAATSGADISHGDRSKPQIALTFHGAGELTIAHQILAITKSTSTPISVMAIGAWLNTNPGIGKEILDLGHDLANHTQNHKTMTHLTLKQASAEVAAGKKSLSKVIGTNYGFFRPSGTQKSNSIIRKAAGAAGYAHCISYDVDTLDYQDPAPSAIVKNCMQSIQNGSIVSLHLGHKNTVKALPLLIQALHEKKLVPVTLTTLLGQV
jgi:peptidoglycan/xylan/chitin deacetylase (PgdA/CDA1 family)